MIGLEMLVVLVVVIVMAWQLGSLKDRVKALESVLEEDEAVRKMIQEAWYTDHLS